MTIAISVRLRSTAAALALGLGAALVFAGAASADPKVLATVDGAPITEDDLAVAMADIGPGLPQKLEGAARHKYVLDYLIDLKLAAKKAEAEKLDQSPEFAKKLAYYRDKLAMEELLASVAKAATTEEAERKAYDEAAKAEPPQEEIHARHILVPTEEEAKKALARVKGGEDFAKVADEFSKDKAGDGGDLGWFTKDRMVPEFSDAAFKLQKGQYTETPIKTQFGYHVIMLVDRRAAPSPSLEEARPQVFTLLQRELLDQKVKELRTGATVEVFNMDGSKPAAAAGTPAPATPATPAPAKPAPAKPAPLKKP